MDSVSGHYMKQARVLLRKAEGRMSYAERHCTKDIFGVSYSALAESASADAADLILMATHLLQKARERRKED
jgi:hypothetical protein